MGRLSKIHGANEAEFGMLVSDLHHGIGLGTELLHSLIDIGRQEQLNRITAEILPENNAMQHLCRKLGFIIESDMNIVRARYDLSSR